MSAPSPWLVPASIALAAWGVGPLGTPWGLGAVPRHPQVEKGPRMEIHRSGSRPSAKGPAETFTGTVRIDPLFQPPAPARALGVSVTFEPGARTAWHTHPLGQTLIVTAGCGLVQSVGGPNHEDLPRRRGLVPAG